MVDSPAASGGESRRLADPVSAGLLASPSSIGVDRDTGSCSPRRKVQSGARHERIRRSANDGGFSGVEAPLGCLLLPCAGGQAQATGTSWVALAPGKPHQSRPAFRGVGDRAGPDPRKVGGHLTGDQIGRREAWHLCLRASLGSTDPALSIASSLLRPMRRGGLDRASPRSFGPFLPADHLRSLRFRPALALQRATRLKWQYGDCG